MMIIPKTLSLLTGILLYSLSAVAWGATACHVEYTVANQWNTGFTGNVKITNQGDALSSWTATWTMTDGQQITGFWNGNHTQNGDVVTVNNANWNGSIVTGASRNFGFNASWSGNNGIPTDFAINGVRCAGQAEPPTGEPEPIACRAHYDIVEQWGTGFKSAVRIENNGRALGGWNVTWDMPNGQQITNLWNGQVSQNNKTITVAHPSWNPNIPKGGAIEFGFVSSHTGINQVPGNIAVDGVLCEGQTPPPEIVENVECTVNYHIREQWNTGFTTDITIDNEGTLLNGWEVTWTMPNEQQITHLWNGAHQQNNDQVTVNNLDWNKTINTGAKIEFGFNGTHQGLNPKPIDLKVNGTRCKGQADSVVLPPTAPEALKASVIDNTNVELTWLDKSDNETQFVIKRRLEGQTWQELARVNADTTSYTDTTLTVGQVYEYLVYAINDSGSSGNSNTVTAKRQDRTDISTKALALNCNSCHGVDGVSEGPAAPTITGMSRTYFIKTMEGFKDDSRYSTIMGRVARAYSSTQIEQLADYFTTKAFVAAEQVTDLETVKSGRTIHQERCTICHADGGRDSSFSGVVLAGQWQPWLEATLEDYHAERSTIPQGMDVQLAGIKDSYGANALAELAEYYAANMTDTEIDGSSSSSSSSSGGSTSGSTSSSSSSSSSSSGSSTSSGSSSSSSGSSTSSGSSSGGDPAQAPNAPSGFSAAVSGNERVNLAWYDQSDNENGFRLERRTSAVDWQLISEPASNTTSYIDNDVLAGENYEYRLSAYNSAGSSDAVASNATLLTTVEYGAAQYLTQGCASCHGADGLGGPLNRPLTRFSAANRDELIQLNSSTMPPANPSACVGNCAESIADYIIATFQDDGSGGNDQACNGIDPASPRSLRLLTRQEYENTVNDLLGLSVSVAYDLPEENRVAGFDNNIFDNLVTERRQEAFLDKAEELANQAVNQNWDGIMPCSTQDDSCATQFINEVGLRAYRRPLSNDEVTNYQQVFSQNDFRSAVEESLMIMLSSPNFLYRSELGEAQADGSYKLTQYEIASSLSYIFWGSMPDDTLLQAAANNQLETDAQRITQASRLLSDARSRQQVGNFVGQWLLQSSPYTLPDKDPNIYPAYNDTVKQALSQELINFFNYVTFDSTQSFGELFTADYILANRDLANFYNVAGPQGETFEVTSVQDGSRQGLFSLGAILARYANSNESHPFKRGAFVFERVLCHELPAPANMGVVETPLPDPNATTRERFDFHSASNTACYDCHQYLDGPGFNFENYDGSGQYRLTENGQAVNATGTLRGLETYTPEEELAVNDLAHLSDIVAQSPTASQCVAKQYYRYATGREESSADSCALDDFLQRYSDNGYNLQTMLLGIVNTPSFIYRRGE